MINSNSFIISEPDIKITSNEVRKKYITTMKSRFKYHVTKKTLNTFLIYYSRLRNEIFTGTLSKFNKKIRV